MSIESIAPRRKQKWSRGRRLIAILSVVGVLSTAAIVATDSSPAWADDYPTWADVEAARSNEAASAAQVTQINALLRQLENELAAAQNEAIIKGEEYQLAEQTYFEATIKADELRAQADAAAASAAESQRRAGQLAAQLARTGSNDLTMNLFLNGDDADDLLAMMGQAGKVSEQANTIYEQAVQDKNTAQALTDEADVASSILEGLKVKAEAAMAEAQRASDAAAAAVAVSEQHQAELQAQLAALTTQTDMTEANYLEGERVREAARIAAEQEAARQAAAAAEQQRQANAAAAAARAAAAAQSGGGGGGGGGGASVAPAGGGSPVGAVNGSNWAKPASGYISSGFGYRIHPVYGTSRLHSGTDLAGGCGIPIYAAHSGTVDYAGWYGTYGNWVLINNGDGVSTGYAHIVNGGIRVSAGQKVSVGQVIAYVGTTGASTGCHLHFEVRVNGVATNAVPYMSRQGITLG